MAITAIGESENYSYTGTVKEFTAPFNGIYMLQVGGACGAVNVSKRTPSYGGVSVGYCKLKAGEKLYIAVGGNGSGTSGGWNGGGDKTTSGYGGGGGGATHIAKTNRGQLRNYAEYKDEILIVAGGGGGPGGYTCHYYDGDREIQYQEQALGGYGGGITGGNGVTGHHFSGTTPGGQTPGNQDAAGDGGGFGYGGSGGAHNGGAGGGGWFGGGYSTSQCAGGGGGSGYIGGVPEITRAGKTYTPTTRIGGSGGGYATITYISKGFPEMFFENTAVDGAFFEDTDVSEFYFEGKEL